MSVNNGRDSNPVVSIVVPVRNEAGNIAPLIAEIEAALAGRAFEIVYINDGSTDATEAQLLALTAEHPSLR
jgi:dolichol-phosphate mannosyltransferase